MGKIIYPYASDFTALLGGECANHRVMPITIVTPHHAAGVVQGENSVKHICEMWKQRGASANYIIDVKGNAYMTVSHDMRAWTSSNRINDMQAITFEMSNDSAKYPWTIGSRTLETAIDLTAWVCSKYGIIPQYDGTKDATITTHRMFASTQCPGDYFVRELLNTGKFIRLVLERKIEWDKRMSEKIETPKPVEDKPNQGKCYVQIGAYKTKGNAVKQAGKANGYSIIHNPHDDIYYVRKICNAEELEKELALARQITPKAFKGVYV